MTINIDKKTLISHFQDLRKTMRCKAKIREKAEHTDEYVSISNEFLTQQRAFCVSPDFKKLSNSTVSNPVSITHKQAAVLIPIIDEPSGLQVLFTQRTMHLKHHPGQISFPGGMMESSDQTLAKTVIREAHEEIGLDIKQINLLGTLEPLISSTQFLVTPFVGLVTPPLNLIIDSYEVASVFTVPLLFLLDPTHQQKQTYTHDNHVKEIDVIEYENHRIWGLTAKILVNLTKVLTNI